MKSWKAALVVVCGLGLAASAWAQCCHGDKAKDTEGASASAKDKSSCAAQAAAAGKDDKSACAGKAAALAGMPQLKYKVGDETTPCSVQAAKLAGGDEAKIKFVVGGTEYSNKTEAMQAYATELKNHLATVTSVRFAVGDKCVSCPMAAGAMAQTSTRKPEKYCTHGKIRCRVIDPPLPCASCS